jgi:HTH-type transcriptional regulator/antitoxin HipB
MNYSVNTAVQLRAVVKALRKTRGLSQADLGRILGVNQKRIAKIESDPGVTSWNQLTRLISALGGRIAIQDAESGPAGGTDTSAIAKSDKRPRQSKKQVSW